MEHVLISCALSALGGNESQVLALSNLFESESIPLTIASRTNDFACLHGASLRRRGIKVITTPFDYSSPSRMRNIWAALFWFRLWNRASFTRLLAIGPGGFHHILKRTLSSHGRAYYWEAGDGLQCKSKAYLHMLRSMDGLAATSSTVARRIERYVDVPVSVLPPLVKFDEPLTSCIAKSRPPHKLVVSFLGRVSQLKGVDILLDIWSQFRNEGVTLHVYGGGSELPEMKNRAASNGLGGAVQFFGEYDRGLQIGSIMQQTDMVVLPSRSEGLPHVLLECMAYGVPFVATDVGGVRDLAINNPNVAVVDCLPESIAFAISQMLDRLRNGDVSSKQLQEYYQAHYGWPSVSRKWLDFLELPSSSPQ